MEAAAHVVTRAALREPSYAGASAFESQAPMKTFMGDVPCVPLPTVVEARSATGPSGAKVGAEILREVIGVDTATCAGAYIPTNDMTRVTVLFSNWPPCSRPAGNPERVSGNAGRP